MTKAAIPKRLRGLALGALAGLALGSGAPAQITVDTLGGGPKQGHPAAAGFADGNTFADSLFNGPTALALDSAGTLFLADKNNGRIRKITAPGDAINSLTITFVGGLSAPVGVAIDPGDNLYVLTQGDGHIRKYNRYANLLGIVASGLTGASALTMDGSTNFFVTLPGTGTNGGVIKKITAAGVVTTVTTGFNQPQGLVMLPSGQLAVSDTGNHALWLVNPTNGAKTLLAGLLGPGATDGTPEFAQFNQPHGLAKSPSGTLVVADRMNHKFRLVATNGTVTTLYGVDTNAWDPHLPEAGLYAGWTDGDSTYAAAREPMSAVVSPAGTVYTTEIYYHLVRSATGAPLGVGGGTTPGGGTNVVTIPVPAFTPDYGYFPMGQVITVTSENPVFYTTDGTEPTTNSLQVPMTGNVGAIVWNEPLRDLTSLRLKAFSGTNASATVSGRSAPANEIGVTRDVVAGSGATVLVPIVMNLRSNDQVRSLQYRVEVTPRNGAPPVRAQFGAISIQSNDFIRVVGASMPGSIGQYSALPYAIPNPTNWLEMIPGGLAISAIGTNANFRVQQFGTVAMLMVPIDPLAREGDTYEISLFNITATSDGGTADVPVQAMPNRFILVTNLNYLVGDSAPATWYGAGDFGDRDLKNNDVNNAFYASLGVRTPFIFSDVFDAMDAFPPDDPLGAVVGGDGEIRYLDWQMILMRALHLDTNNYTRRWTVGGVRATDSTGLPAPLHRKRVKSNSPPAPPGAVWVRQATLWSRPLEWASAGGTGSLPVYVNVAPGCSLGGLSFRAALVAEGDAPPVTGLSFNAAPGRPAPSPVFNPVANEILCGWSLAPSASFVPPLTGPSNLLGYLTFSIPANTLPGRVYTLRFQMVDGAPSLSSQYNLDGIAASVWVGAPAQRPPERVSDQWRTNFFGTLANPLGDPDVDADGDGLPNWKEFLAGTNPTNALSRLHLLPSGWTNAPGRALALRWLSAPGKTYLIERSPNASGGPWTTVASGLVGDGHVQTCLDPNAAGRSQFYRLRIQP